MADLYGTNSNYAPNESDETSSFLHNLLHNSSSAGISNSSPFNSFKVKKAHSFASAPAPAPAPESGEFACGSGFLLHSDSDCRFSDLPGFFPAEAKSGAAAADSDATTSSLQMNFPVENDAGGFDFGTQVPKTSEVPETSAPRSSKRTRAAEIHNLSEKRRRSRINEKLKALQTLIPNSNKTDKASMLDEAIEYLKQLQLQVQMLTMKNGIGLQPIYVQETIPTIMQRGMGYDEGDRLVIPNVGGGSFAQNQEIQIGSEFGTFNHHQTNSSTDVPPSTSITRPETPFDLELSIENQYGLLNHLTSYKDVCRANTPSRLHTDLQFSGKIPSPGVSS